MNLNLTNTAKKLCVIGDPVLHSKSPLIQNAMIQALGLDYIYLCQPVSLEGLPAFLDAAKALGYSGFNATMPHKQALVPLMDVLDEDAQMCQSVNTVCIKDGKLYGYSTDGEGFYRSLQRAGGQVAGANIALIGAGGAAKPVALKLLQQGAKHITVCNRTLEKANVLCQHDTGRMTPTTLKDSALIQAASTADILINCTSLGMEGVAGGFESLAFLDHLPTGAMVCDLIYHPAQTPLLARADALGHPTLNGLGMLIHQGILALEHFTGQNFDADRMEEVVRGVLA